MLFKLSRLAEYQDDDEAAIECLNTILSYEPTNAYALLTIASIQHAYPFIDDNVFERLCAFKTDDPQIQSMFEYMKSRYYSTKSISDKKNKIMEEHHLKKSIELCDTFVWNRVKLSFIYIDRHEFSVARDLLIKALFNIKSVSAEHDYWDFLSIDVYINELVTGIWINNIQYKHILAMLCNFTLDRS